MACCAACCTMACSLAWCLLAAVSSVPAKLGAVLVAIGGADVVLIVVTFPTVVGFDDVTAIIVVFAVCQLLPSGPT